ncbi:hypothetical protein [Thalassomonas haliotis]|uniref:Uncharacterized protein n=1 Tax=Thalassomonas haliotis TaxID=485448 RepID=A0ABY7VA90_9GAMM|nr:hypothetical protein [Thalassomonas haliotis]WDE10548.1 hypothetical protein H3N35_20115 [Thalassomonas haliotis]
MITLLVFMEVATPAFMLEHDEVTILQPGKPVSFFDFKRSSFQLSPVEISGPDREIRALPLFLRGSLAYHKQLYRRQ